MTNEVEQLIHDVLHGQADADAHQRLSDWITASDDNARAYSRVAMDERAIVSSLKRASARSLEELSASPDDSNAGLILAQLAKAEADANAQLVELVELKTSWFRGHAMPLAWAAGVTLVAGVVLAVTLMVGQRADEQSPLVVDWGAPADKPSEAVIDAVATLAAERGVVWQGLAGQTLPVVGEPLVAGQELMLSEGVIQITTQTGAIAIIEAPCRVQIVGDNAVKLEQGKLLGICETPSSKGFVVRTPHMDVTDLGTRFGVDASNPDATEVHVLEGVVLVARAGLDDGPVTLQKDDAVIAQAGENALKTIAAQPVQFAALTPRRIDLPGTGQGLASGAVDPNWQVIAADGERFSRPAYLKVGVAGGGGPETAKNNPAISQWLSGAHVLKKERALQDTVFTCRSFFEVPSGLDHRGSSLVLYFDADEGVEAIRINGESVVVPANSWADDRHGFTTLRVHRGLIAGVNVIELDVLDKVRSGATNWSFHLRWHLEAGLSSPP